MEVRTRYAPSPTGYMHIGNLRTALYEYLIARSNSGKFILRLEDTDLERYVEGATEVIYNTLKIAGLDYDEGPDIGGPYAPYIQSERKDDYIKFARQLVEKEKAYYCFCGKEEHFEAKDIDEHAKYDRRCSKLTKEEVEEKLAKNEKYVIRQFIPEGETTFDDEVYGSITVKNEEIEDQVLIKSDGYPTYNFANVVDDHLMDITHVIRGSEYLSSSPKYNLLYEAFDWKIPKYVHLPLILSSEGKKLSKRRGDASFEDLLQEGFIAEAVINYIALLGWSPSTNQEIFTKEELIKSFDIKGLSKSPSVFDLDKLKWMNSEYIKNLSFDEFYEIVLPFLKNAIKKEDVDLKKIAQMVQTRVQLPKEAMELVDFIDKLPEYSAELYLHKKMKTTKEIALKVLQEFATVLESITDWKEDIIHAEAFKLVEKLGLKNGQVLWPLRTALSGKPSSPCGATELAEIIGKEDSISRINKGIEILSE